MRSIEAVLWPCWHSCSSMLMVLAWTSASGIAATAAGKGHGLAQSLHAWTWQLLDDKNQLPVSLYGRHIKSVITDEDIAQEIHLYLQSLDKKYLCARDIVWYCHKWCS